MLQWARLPKTSEGSIGVRRLDQINEDHDITEAMRGAWLTDYGQMVVPKLDDSAKVGTQMSF